MLAMRRALFGTRPSFSPPNGVQLVKSKLEDPAIREAYLAAQDDSFGYKVMSLEGLEHFTKSNLWLGGIHIGAFAGNELIGSVMALSNGLLDYVFTVPRWQNKGIAKALVSACLLYTSDAADDN